MGSLAGKLEDIWLVSEVQKVYGFVWDYNIG